MAVALLLLLLMLNASYRKKAPPRSPVNRVYGKRQGHGRSKPMKHATVSKVKPTAGNRSPMIQGQPELPAPALRNTHTDTHTHTHTHTRSQGILTRASC